MRAGGAVTPLESNEKELGPDPLEAGRAGDKVIRGGGLRASAHVIGVAVGVVSAPLVVRHLGVDDFGRFILVTSIVYVVTGLTEGGLAQVAIRQYASGPPEGRRRLIGALMGLRIVLSIVGAIGAVAFGLIAGYPEVVVGGLALGGAALLFNNLWGALHTALVAELRLGAVAALEIVRAFATTALFLVLVVAGAGLGPFYAVAPAVAFLTWILHCWVVRGITTLRPRFDGARWKELARETVVYAAAMALAAMYFQVALVTTSILGTDRDTGIYGIAFRIVDLANGVPWLLAGSIFPVLAHAAVHDPQRLRYAVGRMTEAATIAGGWFALSIILGAEFAIDVVGGAEAADSIPVLRILGIGVMATYLVAGWGVVMLSRRRYRPLMLANLTALVLAVVLSLVLIPRFGAQGAAVVTATLEVTLAAIYGVLLARELPGLRTGYTFAPRLVLALVAAFAAGVPLLLVHPVLATVVGGLVYFAVLWALRAIPPELIDAVRRRKD